MLYQLGKKLTLGPTMAVAVAQVVHGLTHLQAGAGGVGWLSMAEKKFCNKNCSKKNTQRTPS